MKIFKFLISIFFILSFVSAGSYAAFSKNDVGTTSAQFLKLGIGARSAAMGNAVASVYNAVDSIYWNPSNLGYIDRKELSFSHTIWFEDISYQWLAFALPTEKLGVFGAAVQYVSYGSINRVDNTNVQYGSFSPLDMAVYLSYANKYKKLLYGANLKYIYSKIENSATAIAADFGVNYDFNDYRTSIGAALTNIGTKMKFNNDEEYLPTLFKTGISHFITYDWLVSFDLNFPRDNEIYFNLGTEYCVELAEKIELALRAGYDGRNKDVPGFSCINLGFGLQYLDYVFDYAFIPYGDIGMTHRFSFSIKFGKNIDKNL
ncbi:MAG: PorV/PorQ family protein [Elusimicrobia bacterium]|nr:PorV/PorQ family protein [Elusimicrobiota bacterium]